ncbi:hypothetical protein Ciccas_001267 [Cichlidogyrus casuarinus]|uniref:Uncharacterized protein n=1 Tax=Cichlidogyrus casuarinus TaxID=1844966 RepID=A0ABD2QKL8_9PLAT
MRMRQLNRLPKCRYFVPAKYIESVSKICKEFGEMHQHGCEDLLSPNIVPVLPGESYEINRKWRVEVFKTDHVVDSVGYVLYYSNASVANVPSIAYTGDTRFSIFATPAHPDLLRVQLLITEATYLDKRESNYERCDMYGHIHITDIFQNAHLFQNILYLHLIHFSDRYSVDEIEMFCKQRAPPQLKHKIYPSYMLKLTNSYLRDY